MKCKVCNKKLIRERNQKKTCSLKCRMSFLGSLSAKKSKTSLSNPEYQKKLLQMALEERKVRFDRIGRKSSEREVIKKTNEYKIWRMSVFVRDDFTCRFCGIKGGELQADHIKPFAYFPELRFAIDNGRTLCKECHRTTDTYGNRAIKLYKSR